MDETDPAHIEGLLANIQIVAAGIGIRVLDRGDYLRERNRVVNQLLRIEFDVVLLGQPAEAIDVEHARHGLVLLFANPVFDLLLFDQVMVGALDRVAIDFSDRIFRRQPRLDALRQVTNCS